MHIDTFAQQQLSLPDRLNLLVQALQQVEAYAALDDLDPKGLLIAPEYLFCSPVQGGIHRAVNDRYLNEAMKTRLLEDLSRISQHFPRWIIIPGTVAWDKPLARTGAKLQHGAGKLNAGQLKTKSRPQKAQEAVERYANAFPGTVGAFDGRDPKLHQEKIDDMVVAGYFNEPVGGIGRNTAYVFYNGRLIHKYNKHGDFHETLGASNTTFTPGVLPGRFSITTSGPTPRELTFGLEICLDHGVGVLRNDNQAKVHVHIILSATVNFVPANGHARPDGYVLHADNRHPTTVWHINNPTVALTNPAAFRFDFNLP
ncbi:hypothetical protein ICA16_23015 [Pseudomonas anatoliensis]|uniref:hypothetical protein n=1 Tax=Pseudomonas anatoliensis TaxID=2710589 RepID=UPI001B32DBFA|nr:hypothetical protein [Pseudomonas anatoliensis]MBP5958549.1 hypothetical protein [Pseudomonas anatoliensis]